MASPPTAEAYYRSLTQWRAPALALREICLDAGLTETLKWSSPCYATVAGGNVALLAIRKADCGLSFPRGALLADEAGLLSAPGPATRSARVARFTHVDAVWAAAKTIRT